MAPLSCPRPDGVKTGASSRRRRRRRRPPPFLPVPSGGGMQLWQACVKVRRRFRTAQKGRPRPRGDPASGRRNQPAPQTGCRRSLCRANRRGAGTHAAGPPRADASAPRTRAQARAPRRRARTHTLAHTHTLRWRACGGRHARAARCPGPPAAPEGPKGTGGAVRPARQRRRDSVRTGPGKPAEPLRPPLPGYAGSCFCVTVGRGSGGDRAGDSR